MYHINKVKSNLMSETNKIIMNEKKINFGIIGPGRIARKFAESLEAVDNGKLYAVASNNKERANNFAKEFNAEKSYFTYNDLVNDPSVDVVYIATPHRFHAEQCHLALDAGKHVICEKPVTVNAKDAEELLNKAHQYKLFFMEALWTRHLPIYKDVVSNWLNLKLIGDVKLLTSTFGFNFERNDLDRKFNHELAGGALLDLGIYNIAISQWAMNQDPISFNAYGYLGKTNVDEMLAVNLDYGNGKISQFSCNFLTENENEFNIYGRVGNIKIHSTFWGATKATLTTKEQKLTVVRPFRKNGFEYQIEEALNCINNGKIESPIMTHYHTLANMKLMDKIREKIGLKYSFE